MQQTNELRRKEVIDICTAESLGTVSDIDVDLKSGKINALILPGGGAFCALFGIKREIVIPWSAVTAIGSRYILVENCSVTDLSRKNNFTY